jgi:hypothetical protein
MDLELSGKEEDLVIYSSCTSWVNSRLMGSTALLVSVYAILGGVFVFCQVN